MTEVTDSEIQQHARYLCEVYQQMKDETIRKMPSNIKRSHYIPDSDGKINCIYANGTYFVSPNTWLHMILGDGGGFWLMVLPEFDDTKLFSSVFFDEYIKPTIPEFARHGVMNYDMPLHV